MSNSDSIHSERKYKVGILGATGTVGQRFIALLEHHEQFAVYKLGASSRSANKQYNDATQWKMSSTLPPGIKNMVISECEPNFFTGCDLIFSGLDSSVASDIEMAFAKAGFPVFSNAKNYRQHPAVPLIVPLVNGDHLELIKHQQQELQFNNGYIVTNSNCVTTGLVVALKPLMDKYGEISHVIINTLQAVSGAGYPGCSAMDMLDNVVPYIDGEEDKVENEPHKILGTLNKDKTTIDFVQTMKISALCHRVGVIDGHTESICIKFKNEPPPTPEQVTQTLAEYISLPQKLGCTTAPPHSIVVCNESDRPQPRLDRHMGLGNSVSVGRIRRCNVLDIKFTLLVHNTVLGAAGSSILNAEMAAKSGYL